MRGPGAILMMFRGRRFASDGIAGDMLGPGGLKRRIFFSFGKTCVALIDADDAALGARNMV